VIFAQMVDDPSANPDLFPTEKAQEKERKRLFGIIEELVKWENTTNERVLQAARDEIWQSWRRACAENVDRPRAKELFNRYKLPAFHDPFAGGGALPLEAQRLGLEAHASDLNPVAVLINKAMIEIPSIFAGRSPVNPESRKDKNLFNREWRGAQGLAEDVRYYGYWMRGEAERRIGQLYPKVEVTADMANDRPDLKATVGKKLSVIAWLWARTVKSPNPAFATVDVPLVASFLLATKPGKEAYIEPVIEGSGYRFTVRVGKPKDSEAAKVGTKLSRGANFRCVMSDTPMTQDYVRGEFRAKKTGRRLMAIVAEGERGRIYLPPTAEAESIARSANPVWHPEDEMNQDTSNLVSGRGYGITHWVDLFTSRQLVALTTFSDLVQEACERAKRDAIATASLPDDSRGLHEGGVGVQGYADAIGTYLAFGIDRTANYCSMACTWHSGAKYETVTSTFGRQALPMTWDFAEANPFSEASGNWSGGIDWIANTIAGLPANTRGFATQTDAAVQSTSDGKVVSTDPPYYDNIGYADLSDFFYIWLRHSLQPIFPNLFATLAVPKAEELVATPYRHGSKEKAETFFLEGMTNALHRLAAKTHPGFPVTIYYAFKQAESDAEGTASTGWDTFLDATIRARFAITGTWPIRTEYTGNLKKNVSALATSIVLVCRSKPDEALTTTRREFIAALKAELPTALAYLQRSNIAPVDLAQAAIGPGMAVYTRYSKVLDASGKPLSVREALALINQTLDEVLAEQEGDFDSDTRWALAWFEQSGFAEGEYGVADTLSKAKNTSVGGMVDAGILVSGRGKVRLRKPSELPPDWEPEKDTRLTVWEMIHHLIRELEDGGESRAASLLARLGSKAEVARELAYRLFTICERKKRPQEALAYNGLVQSWPEIARLAQEGGAPRREQASLFEESEE
jgi:putative DNA methylase